LGCFVKIFGRESEWVFFWDRFVVFGLALTEGSGLHAVKKINSNLL
jgi:hypothetical protein